KNFTIDQVETLPGDQWVCDKNFWSAKYDWDRVNNAMISTDSVHGIVNLVYAVHNKWWKEGRANGEFRAHMWVQKGQDPYYSSLQRGESNFNEIRDFMRFFNEMSPNTAREDYLKEKMSMAAILPHLD